MSTLLHITEERTQENRGKGRHTKNPLNYPKNVKEYFPIWGGKKKKRFNQGLVPTNPTLPLS